MDIKINPSKLNGSVCAVSSKSLAHRYLICSSFADAPTALQCKGSNLDMEATISCLRALGAVITSTEYGYHIIPVRSIPNSVSLDCNQSGATLRFLLPVVGALGTSAKFILRGNLPQRPLGPLLDEMTRMGCSLSYDSCNTIICNGKLKSGDFTIRGDVSSQFISGLMFACVLLPGASRISVTGITVSKPYIQMTEKVLSEFGVHIQNGIISATVLHTPGRIIIEGDWSNAAFFLAANALGSRVSVHDLNESTTQGDHLISRLLNRLKEHAVLDIADTPDLAPILAVVAAQHHGAVLINTSRLRTKESDRVTAVADLLHSLGGRVEITENAMEIFPSTFQGGTVDSFQDHRIAMAAAIAATVASGPVTINDAQCVEKSYPSFWEDYRNLGGTYEQYIR